MGESFRRGVKYFGTGGSDPWDNDGSAGGADGALPGELGY